MKTTTTKPAPIGSVWTATARVYDLSGRMIGTCTDTPNGIAKMLVEQPSAIMVRDSGGRFRDRAEFAGRMAAWNDAPSMFVARVSA